MKRTIAEAMKIAGGKKSEWRRQKNGGGLYLKTASVDPKAFIGENALVFGNAQVYGNARVYGNAHVYGDAQVSGNALVYGNAHVYGDAQVSGNARVYGNAHVYGDAQVSGNALVYGDARVFGDAWDKSPLYIQGSRHFISWYSKNQLKIGCQIHDIQTWEKNFADIGKRANYSAEEIIEYKLYIDLFKANSLVLWGKK